MSAFRCASLCVYIILNMFAVNFYAIQNVNIITMLKGLERRDCRKEPADGLTKSCKKTAREEERAKRRRADQVSNRSEAISFTKLKAAAAAAAMVVAHPKRLLCNRTLAQFD